MNIVITYAEPSTRTSGAPVAPGVCSGHQRGARPLPGVSGLPTTPTGKPFAGEWFGMEPIVTRRPRPDAVSILDPYAASAPRRWSP